jgi:hypothetical protein
VSTALAATDVRQECEEMCSVRGNLWTSDPHVDNSGQEAAAAAPEDDDPDDEEPDDEDPDEDDEDPDDEPVEDDEDDDFELLSPDLAPLPVDFEPLSPDFDSTGAAFFLALPSASALLSLR